MKKRGKGGKPLTPPSFLRSFAREKSIGGGGDRRPRLWDGPGPSSPSFPKKAEEKQPAPPPSDDSAAQAWLRRPKPLRRGDDLHVGRGDFSGKGKTSNGNGRHRPRLLSPPWRSIRGSPRDSEHWSIAPGEGHGGERAAGLPPSSFRAPSAPQGIPGPRPAAPLRPPRAAACGNTGGAIATMYVGWSGIIVSFGMGMNTFGH